METFFRVTGHLGGEFIGHRWIPRTKASDGGGFDVFFDLRMNNGWVNSREAGELIRHRAHYDITIMVSFRKDVGVSGIPCV